MHTLLAFGSATLAVFTLLLGAYIGHFLTHDRWWKEYRLRKLEELYLLVNTYLLVIEESSGRQLDLLQDCQREEELRVKLIHSARELLITKDEKSKPAAAIPMLVELYFPTISPLWKTFADTVDEIQAGLNPLLAPQSKNWTRTEWYDEIVQCRENFYKSLLPRLRTMEHKVLERIVVLGASIKGERPWPFSRFSQP